MKLFTVLWAVLFLFDLQVYANDQALRSELLYYYYVHQMEIDAGLPRTIAPGKSLGGKKYLYWPEFVKYVIDGNWPYTPVGDVRGPTGDWSFSPDDNAVGRSVRGLNINNNYSSRGRLNYNLLNGRAAEINRAHPGQAVGGRELAFLMHESMNDAVQRLGISVGEDRLQTILDTINAIRRVRALQTEPLLENYLLEIPGMKPDYLSEAKDSTQTIIGYRLAARIAADASVLPPDKAKLRGRVTVALRNFGNRAVKPSWPRGIAEHVPIMRALTHVSTQLNDALQSVKAGDPPAPFTRCP